MTGSLGRIAGLRAQIADVTVRTDVAVSSHGSLQCHQTPMMSLMLLRPAGLRVLVVDDLARRNRHQDAVESLGQTYSDQSQPRLMPRLLLSGVLTSSYRHQSARRRVVL
jgi:hypothetical protein